MHGRSYSQVFSTCQQSLVSSVFLVLHEPNMQVIFKFSQGTKKALLAFFLLGHELYCKSLEQDL